MIKIYHNPRCRKSREGLEILEDSGKEFEVVKYLEDVPSKEELRQVLQCLGISAENLVRKNETIWKENYRNRLLTEEEILDAMIENPKLIERPIVIKNNTAVIGRPPENIKNLIS
ncbi:MULTISPECIES: arsenate reductase (glutaredoxin) [Maribacter]|uniref:Arsenate reductase (Glutaredoxin) n=1 Tax=Maribacter flavus TaxID=1658664 RepID=A0ABU7IJ40_9FLAO|nr:MULTISPECIES: arsenate reductase (glutaredoxin) [Maribacter]MDC6405783.1 arsenate reductase (glutaredoxin) [Maribacter sp. PR66]MEE1972965.1 arsenate reductase (glutaredoxin) [Maribacter flavus]